MADVPDIARRKADHIEVAASGEADFRRTTLLEQVHLVHQSLPELAAGDIDLSVELAGVRLAAPVVVTGMTGGTDEAAAINRDLAVAAQATGVAFGLGSQRAMAEHPELAYTFEVRDAAPDVVLIGNIGAVQAAAMGADGVARLARGVGADIMAVHLNPAQEMIQAGGDRDFRGCVDAIAALVRDLEIPVIAKETGCGLSSRAAAALIDAGVSALDVSGAGGTSWVAVEARRAGPGSAAAERGQELWDWGIPTAVSVAACAHRGVDVIASGGLRTGLDVCRAIAIGATAGGMAAPVLRAQRAGGEAGAREFLTRLIDSIRTVALLAGAGRIADLGGVPRHIGPDLRAWFDDLGLRKSHSPR